MNKIALKSYFSKMKNTTFYNTCFLYEKKYYIFDYCSVIGLNDSYDISISNSKSSIVINFISDVKGNSLEVFNYELSDFDIQDENLEVDLKYSFSVESVKKIIKIIDGNKITLLKNKKYNFILKIDNLSTREYGYLLPIEKTFSNIELNNKFYSYFDKNLKFDVDFALRTSTICENKNEILNFALTDLTKYNYYLLEKLLNTLEEKIIELKFAINKNNNDLQDSIDSHKAVKVDPYIMGGFVSGAIGSTAGVLAALDTKERNDNIEYNRITSSKNVIDSNIKMELAFNSALRTFLEIGEIFKCSKNIQDFIIDCYETKVKEMIKDKKDSKKIAIYIALYFIIYLILVLTIFNSFSITVDVIIFILGLFIFISLIGKKIE